MHDDHDKHATEYMWEASIWQHHPFVSTNSEIFQKPEEASQNNQVRFWADLANPAYTWNAQERENRQIPAACLCIIVPETVMRGSVVPEM